MIEQILKKLDNYPEFQVDIFESIPETNVFSIGIYTPGGIYKVEKTCDDENIYMAKGWSHKGNVQWSDAEVKLTNIEDLFKIVSN